MAEQQVARLVAVFSDDGDGKRYHIGTVLANDVPDDVDAALLELWQEWRNEFDDEAWEDGEDDERQDSDFIDWLIEKKGYKVPPLPVTYAVVNPY